MQTISVNYDLKWQLNFAEEYKFTKNGKCFNTKRNKQIKKVVNCRSIGYCIRGKFYTLTFLRNHIQLIPKSELPF